MLHSDINEKYQTNYDIKTGNALCISLNKRPSGPYPGSNMGKQNSH